MPPATAYSRKLYQKGIQTFSWKADDPNGDTLVYDVHYRRVGRHALPPPAQGADRAGAGLGHDHRAQRPLRRPRDRHATPPANPEALALTATRRARPSTSTTRRPRVTASLAAGPAPASARVVTRRQQPRAPGGVLGGRRPLGGGPPAGRDQRRARGAYEIALADLAGAGTARRGRARDGPAGQRCHRRASRSPSGPDVRVLLVRAGALGDVLLLRRAIAALRAAGHEVEPARPRGAGAALAGARALRGPRAPVAGTAPTIARCSRTRDARRRSLAAPRGFDAALAFTRSADLVDPPARGRAARDRPRPAPAAGHASAVAGRSRARARRRGRARPPPCMAPRTRSARRPVRSSPRLPPRFLAVHPGSGSPRKNWPLDASRSWSSALVRPAVAARRRPRGRGRGRRVWRAAPDVVVARSPAARACSGPSCARPGSTSATTRA